MTDEEAKQILEKEYQLLREHPKDVKWDELNIGWLHETELREFKDYIDVRKIIRYSCDISIDYIREILPHLTIQELNLIQDRLNGYGTIFIKDIRKKREELANEFIRRLKIQKEVG